MLDIETFMNARTGHTININLSTKSIHCDNRGQIFRKLAVRLVKKSRLEKSLERQTHKKSLAFFLHLHYRFVP
jgi:hypothetical protein